jgi:hypothetical protein
MSVCEAAGARALRLAIDRIHADETSVPVQAKASAAPANYGPTCG